MAKVKNESGIALDLPEFGRFVLPGQVIEVPDDLAHRFTQSAIWSPVDKAARAAQEAGTSGAGEQEPADTITEKGD